MRLWANNGLLVFYGKVSDSIDYCTRRLDFIYYVNID